MSLAAHQAVGLEGTCWPRQVVQSPRHTHCTHLSGSGAAELGTRPSESLNVPGGQERAGRMAPLWLQCVLPDTPPHSPWASRSLQHLCPKGRGDLMAKKCLKLNYSNSLPSSCPQWLLGPEIPSSGLGEVGAGVREANGSRLPQAPLRLEADTPGPERFLITAQEPNYLHALGSGDSGLPQGPNTGLCPPAPAPPPAQAASFAWPFAYIYIQPLSTDLQWPLQNHECPSLLS